MWRRATASLRNRDGRLPVSRLAFTILAANLLGVLVLLLGSVGLNQYRDGLIEAKLEGVRGQAQMLAGIIAAVAAEDAECAIALPGEGGAQGAEGAALCDLPLDETSVRNIFENVWDGFEGRVRIFEAPPGYDGGPIASADALLIDDKVLREGRFEVEDLAVEPEDPAAIIGALSRAKDWVVTTLIEPGFRAEVEARTLEDELSRAFASSGGAEQLGATSVRYDEDGEIVASVSVPIRRVQATYGVVTAEIGGIDELIGQARRDVIPFFLLALVASLASTAYLTAAIARPVRRLASAAVGKDGTVDLKGEFLGL